MNSHLIPLAFLSQAATASDISQRKQKGESHAETDVPITDLEIPAIHRNLEADTIEESPTRDGIPLQCRADGDGGDEDSPNTSLQDTNDNQSQGSRRSLCDSEGEENVENSNKVDIEGDLDIGTTSIYRAEAIEENRSFDVEEGPVILVGTVEEKEKGDDENQALDSLASCHSSASGSLPTTCPRARRSTLSSDESSLEHVCPICLGAYQQGTMLFVSQQCAHIFHVDCILEWLTKHEDCPICRVKMVTEEEMVTAAMALVNKTTRR